MTTQRLVHGGGTLAYSSQGDGPLIICVPGMGDLRQEYRFLTPTLVADGFRVAEMDLRGHGGSSTDWDDVSPEAIGSDVLALIDHLGAGDAIVIGTSMAAGAAVWAAVERPTAVTGIVLIGPFVRDEGSGLKVRLSRGLFRIALARPWGPAFWMRYWASLFPSRRPDDFESYSWHLRENLSQPPRWSVLRRMMLGPPRTEIDARLSRVGAPALVVMGSMDRDFKDPDEEARLVARPLDARVAMIPGAGHYPHVEFPELTAGHVLAFAAAAALARERRRSPEVHAL